MLFDSFRTVVPAVAIPRLTRAFCEVLALEEADLRKLDLAHSRSSKNRFCEQRWVLWSICRELTGASYPQVARAFGYVDHTTIMYGMKRLRSILDANPKKAEDYAGLLEYCRLELEEAA